MKCLTIKELLMMCDELVAEGEGNKKILLFSDEADYLNPLTYGFHNVSKLYDLPSNCIGEYDDYVTLG